MICFFGYIQEHDLVSDATKTTFLFLNTQSKSNPEACYKRINPKSWLVKIIVLEATANCLGPFHLFSSN